jgi:hypothetical protein
MTPQEFAVSISYHSDVIVAAATTWNFAGQLFDANGNVFDCTNCTFVWGLLDPNANPVTTVNGNVSISKTDPTNGGIQIEVPAAYTDLPPGRFTDVLEVTEGASTDVFWMGNILVAANPFASVNRAG